LVSVHPGIDAVAAARWLSRLGESGVELSASGSVAGLGVLVATRDRPGVDRLLSAVGWPGGDGVRRKLDDGFSIRLVRGDFARGALVGLTLYGEDPVDRLRRRRVFARGLRVTPAVPLSEKIYYDVRALRASALNALGEALARTLRWTQVDRARLAHLLDAAFRLGWVQTLAAEPASRSLKVDVARPDEVRLRLLAPGVSDLPPFVRPPAYAGLRLTPERMLEARLYARPIRTPDLAVILARFA
jgi:hypothetical protein